MTTASAIDYDSMPLIQEGGIIPGMHGTERSGKWTSRMSEDMERKLGRYHGEWERITDKPEQKSIYAEGGMLDAPAHQYRIKRFMGGKVDSDETVWIHVKEL
ncbi:MAG: hypothetical protein GY722_14115 [bacterium]|nr:hypothetical protein [bacterium]